MIDRWIYNFFSTLDKVCEWMDTLLRMKKKIKRKNKR